MVIEFNLKNLSQYEETLKNIKDGLIKQEPVLKQIAVFYLGQVMRTFEQQGARAGHEKWEKLSPMTLAIREWKAKKLGYARARGLGTYEPRILQDTGVLRGSILAGIETENKRIIWASVQTSKKSSSLSDRVVFGPTGPALSYAYKHQFGGIFPAPERWKKRRTVKIKKREFLFFMGSDIAMFNKLYSDYLKAQRDKK